MKQKLTALLIVITATVLYGLNNNALAKKPHKKPLAKSTPAKKPVSEIQQGEGLIAKSDCLSCHRLDVKLIGPSYKDVAAKYPPTDDNYNYLIAKIMNGGSGVWGPVAMSPHPTLKSTDVKKMVKYILSIK